jgi:hypothetical protein
MADLTMEQKNEAYISWRAAIIALTECQTALRDLEGELGGNVSIQHISGFAEDADWSKQTFEQFLADREQAEWRANN